MEDTIREMLTITRADWLGDPLERRPAQDRDSETDGEFGAAASGRPMGRMSGTHRRAYRTGGSSHGHAKRGPAGGKTVRDWVLAPGQVKRSQKERR